MSTIKAKCCPSGAVSEVQGIQFLGFRYRSTPGSEVLPLRGIIGFYKLPCEALAVTTYFSGGAVYLPRKSTVLVGLWMII